MTAISAYDRAISEAAALTCKNGVLDVGLRDGLDAASLRGQAYSWTSSLSASSGDNLIYLRNDLGDTVLRPRFIYAISSKRVDYGVKFVTGTPLGTPIDDVILNKVISPAPEANATGYGDAAVTGLSDAGVIAVGSSAVDDHMFIDLGDAVMLGQDGAVAVDIETTTGAAVIKVAIWAYFQDD